MTFSKFDDHFSPLFKQTEIIKFHDLVVFLMAIFMHKYHSNLLPITFERFFVRVNEVHNYNTRLSSKISYSIPGVRTNYGKFDIRFQGVKVVEGYRWKLKIPFSLSLQKDIENWLHRRLLVFFILRMTYCLPLFLRFLLNIEWIVFCWFFRGVFSFFFFLSNL